VEDAAAIIGAVGVGVGGVIILEADIAFGVAFAADTVNSTLDFLGVIHDV